MSNPRNAKEMLATGKKAYQYWTENRRVDDAILFMFYSVCAAALSGKVKP